MNLNTQQQLAVDTLDGPLLVLAGAGTGKTKTLVARIASIISSGCALHNQIMAVTFTNKAAGEMMNRIRGVVAGDLDFKWIGTFHSIGSKILRAHAEEIGLKSDFTILDTDDQLKLLKKVATELNLECDRSTLKKYLSIIQMWKDRSLTPQKVEYNDNIENLLQEQALQCYAVYQRRIVASNAADFGDLLLHNISIFNKCSNILEKYREQFKYIMVDEYQDTNTSQYLWLRLLAQKYKNICCVGDDDQSIYGWRGAEITNILNFSKDFDNAQIIKLEQNYRSTNEILEAADLIIRRNNKRLHKKLWTDKSGESVHMFSFYDGVEEATHITNVIMNSITSFSPKETAILVRASFQTRMFEEACITKRLPYKIIGGMKFYERKEIKDIIAYLRISINSDDNLAFERIVNTPKRGVGGAAVSKIYSFSVEGGNSMFSSAKLLLDRGEIKGKRLSDFIAQIEEFKLEAQKYTLADLLKRIMDRSGYLQMLKNDEDASKIENLQELLNVASQFDNSVDFLEHVSLVSDSDSVDEQNAIKIMTIHSSKGLEFDQVFLPGWEEGVFPHQRCLDNTKSLEEERRLAYVGITRAKRRLIISSAKRRLIRNSWQNSRKSRFLEDLSELLEMNS